MVHIPDTSNLLTIFHYNWSIIINVFSVMLQLFDMIHYLYLCKTLSLVNTKYVASFWLTIQCIFCLNFIVQYHFAIPRMKQHTLSQYSMQTNVYRIPGRQTQLDTYQWYTSYYFTYHPNLSMICKHCLNNALMWKFCIGSIYFIENI